MLVVMSPVLGLMSNPTTLPPSPLLYSTSDSQWSEGLSLISSTTNLISNSVEGKMVSGLTEVVRVAGVAGLVGPAQTNSQLGTDFLSSSWSSSRADMTLL